MNISKGRSIFKAGYSGSEAVSPKAPVRLLDDERDLMREAEGRSVKNV